jgi:methylenetetrahydrofolate reductase (NADPH)
MIDDPSIIWTSVIQTLLLPYLAGLQVESPEKLLDAFENRRDDPQGGAGAGRRLVDVQCSELRRAGAPGIHFFTVNRSAATRAILPDLIGARPWARAD